MIRRLLALALFVLPAYACGAGSGAAATSTAGSPSDAECDSVPDDDAHQTHCALPLAVGTPCRAWLWTADDDASSAAYLRVPPPGSHPRIRDLGDAMPCTFSVVAASAEREAFLGIDCGVGEPIDHGRCQARVETRRVRAVLTCDPSIDTNGRDLPASPSPPRAAEPPAHIICDNPSRTCWDHRREALRRPQLRCSEVWRSESGPRDARSVEPTRDVVAESAEQRDDEQNLDDEADADPGPHRADDRHEREDADPHEDERHHR